MCQLDDFHLFLVQLLGHLLRKFLTAIIEEISKIEVIELWRRLIWKSLN